MLSRSRLLRPWPLAASAWPVARSVPIRGTSASRAATAVHRAQHRCGVLPANQPFGMQLRWSTSVVAGASATSGASGLHPLPSFPQGADVPHVADTSTTAADSPTVPTAARDPATTVLGTADAQPARDAAADTQVPASDGSGGDGAKAPAVIRRSIPMRIAGAVLFVLSPLRPVALLIAKAVPWVLTRVPVGVGAMGGFTTAAALIHFHVLAIPLAVAIGAVIAAVRPTAVIVNFFQQPVVNDLASGPGALLTKIPVVGNFFVLLPLVPGAAKLTRWGALRMVVENGALAMTPGLSQARAAYRVGMVVHSAVSASGTPDAEKSTTPTKPPSIFSRLMRGGFRAAGLGLRIMWVSGVLTSAVVWYFFWGRLPF